MPGQLDPKAGFAWALGTPQCCLGCLGSPVQGLSSLPLITTLQAPEPLVLSPSSVTLLP